VLVADGLQRSFGSNVALDDVGFTLNAGSGLTVFGPNGAGKTTLLRVIAGLLRPSKGTVSIDGIPFKGREPAVRGKIGWISHQSLLYDLLSPLENLVFTARLYGLTDPYDAATRALERLGLSDRLHQPVRTLSRGLMQRVTIARALIHRPSLLLLDEPFTGLDIAAAKQLRELLAAEVREGHTVVLVTHNVEEGYELASHVAMMRRGKLLEFGSRDRFSVASLSERYRKLMTDA
jgi:heme exporter protein A